MLNKIPPPFKICRVVWELHCLNESSEAHRQPGVGVGVSVVSFVGVVGDFAIMQHLSDCHGSAIFRIASEKLGIWPNSYQHPMQFDLFRTSSNF
jgi:hypothetical protein